MKRIHYLILLALSAGAPAYVLAADSPQAAPATTQASAVALSDVMNQPKLYANKTLTVTGRYAGMCADGADFYFKDRLSTIEVLLPPGGMPKGLKLGTPLRVHGQVLVRGGEGEEGEVLIKPTAVEPDTSAAKAP